MHKKMKYIDCNLCNSNETTLLFVKDGFNHVKCNSCGLIYVNPRLEDSQETLDSFYTSGADADSFIKDLLKRAYSPKRQKIFSAEIKKMERYRRLNRILDIGCSFGGFLYAARNCGWEIKGIETVQEVGNYGKELYDLDIFLGKLEDSNLPPSSFDVIRLNNIIEHIPDPSEFLSRTYLLLRKGGLLTVSTTNFDSFSVSLCGKEWIYFDGQHHIVLFTPATLKRLLEKSGFTTIDLYTKGFHIKIKDHHAGLIKDMLLKISEKIVSQLIPFTKKGHRLRVLAEKRYCLPGQAETDFDKKIPEKE
ncbi:MAG: class I SAM-dependent methyltransferase [Candidatus Scalindua sp.]|nr:class I SAM-dependent methyltransferase [Candidatus Scalindua sp.]